MWEKLFTTYNMVEPPEDYKDNPDLLIKDLGYGFNDDFMGLSMMTSTNSAIESSYPGVTSPFASDSQLESPFNTDLSSKDKSSNKSTKHTTSNLGMEVVDIARQFIGKPYVWGGTNPDSGFDCSGLIQYAYKQIGIDIPRISHNIGKIGTSVKLSEVQPGDVIYTTSKGPSGGHVKMVSSINNGKIFVIEAIGKGQGVKERELTSTSNIKSIRRIISNNDKKTQSTQTKAFGSEKDFAKTMYSHLYKALQNNGVDADTWAPILTAHTSIESRWGNELSRKLNNYGGIKGEGSGQVETTEWSPQRGYYTITGSFKSFDSIDAFADAYVKKLKNNFGAFNGTTDQYLANIRRHGYFTAKLEDYQRIFNDRLSKVRKYL